MTVVLAACLALCAFSSQPVDERKAQEALPKSQHPMWQQLAKAQVHMDPKEGYFSATFPPEIKALSGKEVTVSGFILPLETTPKFKHFLLSKRTPTCAFCPPGEPNEIVDVWLDQPIAYTEHIVTVKGTFSLMHDREMGLFFRLKPALVM